MSTPRVDEWTEAYKAGWKGICVEAAFQHPAKFSRSLISMIYAHAKAEGWVWPGCWVLDPFSGVSLGAHDALLQGYNVVHVELEPKFHELANQNLELWAQRYAHLPGYGKAVLRQGDSRKLAQVLAQVDCVCSSPPYASSDTQPTQLGTGKGTRASGQSADRNKGDYHYPQAPGSLGTLPAGEGVEAVISSPPFAGVLPCRDTNKNMQALHDAMHRDGKAHGGKVGTSLGQDYGSTPGQLGTLPAGPGLDVIVSSPPYADRCANDNQRTLARDGLQQGHNEGDGATYGQTPDQLSAMPITDLAISSPPYADGCGQQGHDYHPERMVGTRTGYLQQDAQGYGDSPQNLGNMATGPVEAVVSSPPYEGNRFDGGEESLKEKQGFSLGYSKHGGYGDNNNGQLGQTQGDTFWSAARTILEQIFSVLRPNGCAIFVVKNYIRDAREVDFTGDWAKLCQAVGFEWLHHHKALLVETHGTQRDLFGGPDQVEETHRKSFFRRLSERKGAPPINYESVLCFRKPLANTLPLQEGGPQMALSSPPYAGAGEVLGTHNGIDYSKSQGTGKRLTPGREMGTYGHALGQLGAMPAGEFECAISSSPYNLPMSQDHNGSKGGQRGTTPSETGAFVKYGSSPGQLEGLPQGAIETVIASPPYCHGLGKEHTYADDAKRNKDGHRRIMREKGIADPFYGSSEGNIANFPEGPTPCP